MSGKGGVNKVGTSRTFMVPESFLLIYLRELCKEDGIKMGVTWRMLRVPVRRLGVLDHP